MLKDFRKWCHLLASLEANRYDQNVLDLNLILSGAAQRSEWQQPLLQLQASLFQRLEPDVVSGNSLLGTFAKSKRWELACSFFWLFFKQRQPNAISRTSLAAACEKAGKWTTALRGLCNPYEDVVACATAVSACGQGPAVSKLSA
eukprot:symbB.v1.2.037416.t1/scaffold5518.1/size26226/5